MAALRTYFINLVLRSVVKRRLAACRTPLEARKVFDAAASRTPGGVRVTPATIAGVAGEWVEADNGARGATLLYLHGGGYIGMSPRTHRAITGAFALRGFSVFAADYRLAPEHPFPAALDDAATVWRALRAKVEGPIFVAGDSAGGGLCVALLLDLRDHGEEAPAAACLFSPWTDLAATGASLKTNRRRDPLLVADGMQAVAAAYVGAADPRAPLISPIYGEFSGLPPLLIFVGDGEILLDDAKRLAERGRAAGVAVDLRVYPDMPHAWPFLNAILPEGRQALDEAAAFLSAAGGATTAASAAGAIGSKTTAA
ncbi:MAG: alpha/beta hydrolase [Roseiarcus sp.]